MLKLNSTISVGNILTMLGGVIVAVMWFATIERANAKRDEKMVYIEKRVTKNEAMSQDIQKIKVDVGKMQEKQDLMLELLRETRRR